MKTWHALIGGFPREAVADCTSWTQIVHTSLELTKLAPVIRRDEQQRIRRVARDYSVDPAGFAALLGKPS